MKSKINLAFRILAVVFSLVAIISFVLPFTSYNQENLNGIVYIGVAVRALNPIFAWPFFALLCAGLAFILSLSSLIAFWSIELKLRGIATGVVSLIGILFMHGFRIKASSYHYHNGIGIYICMVALLLALVSSVICIVTYEKEASDDEPIESLYPPNSLSVK